MNGTQVTFIKLFLFLHVIDFRGRDSMPCPRNRNRSRLSLSDSIVNSRLRGFAKEKQRRHEDDSVNLGEKGCYFNNGYKRRSLFTEREKGKNEKGSVVSVTLATPTMRAYG